MTSPTTEPMSNPMRHREEADVSAPKGSQGAAVMRIALGLSIVATWGSNVLNGLYTADGLRGFFDWLFLPAEDGGNGSALGFYEAFLDGVVGPVAGPFGVAQIVLELAIGLGLLFGIGTRLAAIGAFVFFANLFLAYFGGEEWIFTYILLMAGAVAVFLDWGGRRLGVDQVLARRFGESPGRLIW